MLPPHRLTERQHRAARAALEHPQPAPSAPRVEQRKVSMIGYSVDRNTAHIVCLVDALVARATNRTPRDPLAREYADRGKLFAALGHSALMGLSRDRGLHPDQNSAEVIRLALTTADYANALRTAWNAVMAPAYTTARSISRLLAARRDFADFRETNVLRPGEFPTPTRVGESGEVKSVTFTENGEIGQLATYASILALSRPALINDEVGLFGQLAESAALACVAREEEVFFSMLTSGTASNGPTLRDAAQLFASSRGNLAASGSAISTTPIGVARAAMLNQSSPSGVAGVAVPKFLVCSPSLVTLAEVELSKLSAGADPSTRIVPIAAPSLGASTAWYLVSDPAQHPAFVYGYWAGASGPIVSAQADWASEGMRFKVDLDYAVAVASPLAIYRNPGA